MEFTSVGADRFRQLTVNQLEWNVDLARFRVAIAPFGGPIALVRDGRKAVMLGVDDDEGGRPKMRIFLCTGKLLAEFIVCESFPSFSSLTLICA